MELRLHQGNGRFQKMANNDKACDSNGKNNDKEGSNNCPNVINKEK